MMLSNFFQYRLICIQAAAHKIKVEIVKFSDMLNKGDILDLFNKIMIILYLYVSY